MDKKIGIAIIIIVVLMIIIGIVTFVILSNERQSEDKDNVTSEVEKNDININASERYMINKIVNQFFDSINKSSYYNMDGSEYDMSEVNLQVYNLLSKQYVIQKEVKKEKVFDYVYKVDCNNMIIPVSISKIEKVGGIEYLYTGKFVNMENKEDKLKDVSIKIYLDTTNQLYSVEPFANNNEFECEEVSIEKNLSNKMLKDESNDEKIAKSIFNDLKVFILRDSKFVYDNLLNKEFKEKRFSKYSEYQDYLEKNIKMLEIMTLKGFKVLEYEKYIQYVLADNNECEYVVNIMKSGSYEIFLDNYTINQQESIKKYENGSYEEKIAMNLIKIVDAARIGDFKYLFNHMNDGYKKNNFENEEAVYEYIKKLFDKDIELNDVIIKSKDDIYQVKFELIDMIEYNKSQITILDPAAGKPEYIKDVTILMIFKDDGEFEFSFAS